ncbi:MAG: peptide ABC transporter substrate-binding protein [Clostridiales bacterium]|nr:peptide ABC transporter substrate-binding protein [Clostridiales bacterium]
MKKFLLTAAFMLCLSGCFENTAKETEPLLPAPTETETVAPTETLPTYGGTLKVPMRQPTTLNPLYNEDTTVDSVLKLLFEPLMAVNQQLEPQANLGSFNFASDGLSVTIDLREGLVWSDGIPMTTEDIVFSLDTLQNAPDNAIYKQNVSNISPTYFITDERKIKLEFLQPYSGMAYELCFPIIPKHYYEGETDPASDANMKPVGNGLYVFLEYDNTKSMALNFNPNTYRKKPYIASVEAVVVPDQESELYAFDQRLIDIVSAEIADWGKYRTNPETNINEYTTGYYDFVGFNFNTVAMSKRAVREAVAHALNIDDIVNSIYLGHATRTYTAVNPNSWLFEPDVRQYEFDLEKSSNLLASAGYNDSNKLNLRLLVNTENSERVKIAAILYKNLTQLGVTVQLEQLRFAEYKKKLDEKDFDLFIGGLNLSIAPDLSFAFGYDTLSDNMFAYRDDSTNALLAAAFQAAGQNSHKKAMSDLQKRLAEELPCVSLVFRKSAMLSDRRVYGEKRPTAINIFANINEWFIVR